MSDSCDSTDKTEFSCKEGILLDLSEPVAIPTPPLNVLDSIELFREEVTGNISVNVSISELSLKAEEQNDDVSNISPPCQKSKADNSGDCKPLEDEVFDFDLPVTPVTISDKSTSESPSTQDDEEEVFFGPVKYRERIAASTIRSATKDRVSDSPLNERQWAEMHREANRLVKRLAKSVDPANSKPSIKQKLFESGVMKTRSSKKVIENRENIDPDNGTLLNPADFNMAVNSTCDKTLKVQNNLDNCGNDRIETPSKHHNRSLTYSVDKTPVTDKLTDVGKSLPVIGAEVATGSGKKKDIMGGKDSTVDHLTVTKTLEEVENGERAKSKPKQSGLSKLRKPSIKMKDRNCVPAVQKLKRRSSPIKTTNEHDPKSETLKPSPKNEGPTQGQNKPRSHLAVPKAQPLKKSPMNTTGIPKSRLSAGITTTNGSASKLQKPIKSGLVKPSMSNSAGKVSQLKPSVQDGTKGELKVDSSKKSGLPSKTLPTSRLQLLKPSGLQRPSALTKPGDNLKKTGPMKAFAPASQQQEQALNHNTPAKLEKFVKRKNLSTSFSTPSKSSSCSSMDSPASSVKKRRSALPTPSKSRTSSVGHIPSPSSSRGSSTSSVRSLESPQVSSSADKRRSSTVTRSTTKSGSVSDINDRSPSSMMPKRQLVVNTPNLPKKKVSPWSPIQKKRPLDQFEEATRCTKKFMN